MSAQILNQAMALVKVGKRAEARELLEPLVKTDVHNVRAWIWYAETWTNVEQKSKIMTVCLRHNPGNEMALRAQAALKKSQLEGASPTAQPAPFTGTVSRRCPQCGAALQAHDVQCAFCQHDLDTSGLQIAREPDEPPLVAQVRPAARRRLGLWPLIGLLFIITVVLISLWIFQLPAPNRNALAIGESALVTSVEIAIQPPVELDFMTRNEVYEMRRVAVYRYANLISDAYQPSEAVFGQIVDGLPWWGIAGQFYFDAGEDSIEGPSEESRFILNPYVLVAAEPWRMWNSSQVSEEAVRRSEVALYCEPTRLRWQPSVAYAELFYDADCVAQVDYSGFDLIVYNARDMNLNYIYVSYEASYNVTKQDPPVSAYAIPQYIHQGNSCGYPGGCNNMSPPTPEIDGLRVTDLPARVVTRLWHEEPDSVEQPPDMTFVIRFQ